MMNCSGMFYAMSSHSTSLNQRYLPQKMSRRVNRLICLGKALENGQITQVDFSFR